MEELGVTEQHVVDSIGLRVNEAIKNARSLLEQLEKLEDADWSSLMAPQYKEAAIKLLEGLNGLARNLGDAQVMVLIAQVLAKVDSD